MTTAAAHLHRVTHQCDACPAEAQWSLVMTDDRELRLCNHHYDKSTVDLRDWFSYRLSAENAHVTTSTPTRVREVQT